MELEQRERVFKKLGDIVGTKYVSIADFELACYAKDAVPFLAKNLPGHVPDMVVWPKTTDEVVQIIRLANKEKICLVPRGAGTSRSGSATPVKGGIIIDMRRMNRIIEIDKENLCVTVEAGITCWDVYNAVREEGYFFTYLIAPRKGATIGGSIAANGLCTFLEAMYGRMPQILLGLEVVLPTGEVMNVGSKASWRGAGYDLMSLFMGSEGTLGIMTRATLKIFTEPQHRSLAAMLFNDFPTACKFSVKILEQRLNPECLFVQEARKFRKSLAGSEDRWGKEVPVTAGIVALSFAGPQEVAEAQMEFVRKLCTQWGGKELSAGFIQLWWQNRLQDYPLRTPTDASEKIKKKYAPDVSIPTTAIDPIYAQFVESADKYGIDLIGGAFLPRTSCFYFDILFDDTTNDGFAKLRQYNETIQRIAVREGGSMGGYIGTGLMLADLMPEHLAPALDVMKKIKRILDPNSVLNPGRWLE